MVHCLFGLVSYDDPMFKGEDGFTPQKTKMTMENRPFEDVCPIENWDFQCHVSFQGCKFTFFPLQIQVIQGEVARCEWSS